MSLEIFQAQPAIEVLEVAYKAGYRFFKLVEQSTYYRLFCNARLRGTDGIYGNFRGKFTLKSNEFGAVKSSTPQRYLCHTESGSGPLGEEALDYLTGLMWRPLPSGISSDPPENHGPFLDAEEDLRDPLADGIDPILAAEDLRAGMDGPGMSFLTRPQWVPSRLLNERRARHGGSREAAMGSTGFPGAAPNISNLNFAVEDAVGGNRNPPPEEGGVEDPRSNWYRIVNLRTELNLLLHEREYSATDPTYTSEVITPRPITPTFGYTKEKHPHSVGPWLHDVRRDVSW